MRDDVGFPEIILSTVWVIIPVVAIVVGYLVKRLKTEERLRLIEKGLPLPPEPLRLHDPWRSAAGFRLAGIINVAVGLGLLILFVALAATLSAEFPKGVIAVSAIPFLVGLGLLFEYRLRVRELKAGERSKLGA